MILIFFLLIKLIDSTGNQWPYYGRYQETLEMYLYCWWKCKLKKQKKMGSGVNRWIISAFVISTQIHVHSLHSSVPPNAISRGQMTALTPNTKVCTVRVLNNNQETRFSIISQPKQSLHAFKRHWKLLNKLPMAFQGIWKTISFLSITDKTECTATCFYEENMLLKSLTFRHITKSTFSLRADFEWYISYEFVAN